MGSYQSNPNDPYTMLAAVQRYETGMGCVLALNLIMLLKLYGISEGRTVALWMGTGVVSMSNRRYNRRKESIGARGWRVVCVE